MSRKSIINDEPRFILVVLEDADHQETYRKMVSPYTEWQFDPDENDVFVWISDAINHTYKGGGFVSDLHTVGR